MSDTPIDAHWWLASDGKWYPPTLRNDLHLVTEDEPPTRPDPPTLPADAQPTAGELMHLPMTFHIVHGFGRGSRDYVVNHLVIGPTGIWVIISTNELGTLVKQGGALWNGSASTSPKVEQVEALAKFARSVLGFEANPVLCFQRAKLPRPAQMIGKVRVLELGAINEQVSSGRTTMRAEQIDVAVERVGDWLRQAPTAPVRRVAERRPVSTKRRIAIVAAAAAAVGATATLGASMLPEVSMARTDSTPPTTTVAPTTTAAPSDLLTIDVTCPRRGLGYQLIPRAVSTGLSQLQVAATVQGQAIFVGPLESGQPGPPIMGVPSSTTVGFDFLVVDAAGQSHPSQHLDFATPPWPC